MENGHFLSHNVHRLIEAMLSNCQAMNYNSSNILFTLLLELRTALEDINPKFINVKDLDNLAESLKSIHQSNSTDGQILLPIILFLIKNNKAIKDNKDIEALEVKDNDIISEKTSAQLVNVSNNNDMVVFPETFVPSLVISRIIKKFRLASITWFVMGLIFAIITAYSSPWITWLIESKIFLKTVDIFKNHAVSSAISNSNVPSEVEDFFSNPLLNENIYLNTFGKIYTFGYRFLVICPLFLITIMSFIYSLIFLIKYLSYRDMELEELISDQRIIARASQNRKSK